MATYLDGKEVAGEKYDKLNIEYEFPIRLADCSGT